MQIVKFYKKHENSILALAAVICMVCFVGLKFDYYYQANDDIFIKNILSGAYSGTPESHNIQMHFPLSLLLSLLYRIAGSLPVYGLFLCVCHYGCSYLWMERSLKLVQSTLGKLLLTGLEAVLFTALLLPELVFTQYTVTCALLAAAAAFRFYTTPKGLGVKEFWLCNVGNIFLLILAFLVRSEMLLLMLPLVCVAGFFKWMTEKPIFTKENTIKYFGTIGFILAGLLVGQLVHMLAYSGESWKEFNRFFDERTQLYDYQFIPSYEEHGEFYESIGLSESEQELLDNYNFGMDADINSEVLKKTAQYAAELKAQGNSFGQRLRVALEDYKYKLFSETDYPWNFVVFACYALLFLLAWKNKTYAYIWKLPLLFLVRSGLWMYMIFGGRYPERITHSLYLMELILLAVFLLEECRKEQEQGLPCKIFAKWQKSAFTILTILVLSVLGIQILSVQTARVTAESAKRDYANREIQGLDAYCKQNPENFYFVDVYSAVSCTDYVMSDTAIEYSEKIFENVDNSLLNYDILGGWLQKSPLTDKKLEQFEIKQAEASKNASMSSIELAILDMKNVYVIIKTEDSTEWLTSYYEEKHGIKTAVKEKDWILLDGQPIYTVYQVENDSSAEE